MSGSAHGSGALASAPSRGVLFIASGAPFVAAACAAAQSVRRNAPNLPIALFADRASLANARVASVFDLVRPIADPHRRSKVDCLAETPFDRTLYLDADTRVYGSIAEIFDLLERFDVALAHAHARNRALTNEPWRVRLPVSFPQFNGGVIAFRRNPAVEDFLRAWRDAYHRAGFRKDQVTLRELLWSSQLRIATLPPEYNVRRFAYLLFWRRREAAPRLLHLKSYARDDAWARFVDRVARAVSTAAWDSSDRAVRAPAAPEARSAR